jgi:hypothetical protein
MNFLNFLIFNFFFRLPIVETSVKSNTQSSPCKNPYSFAPAYVNKAPRVLQSSDAVFGESIGRVQLLFSMQY